jgi:hypothetical protein
LVISLKSAFCLFDQQINQEQITVQGHEKKLTVYGDENQLPIKVNISKSGTDASNFLAYRAPSKQHNANTIDAENIENGSQATAAAPTKARKKARFAQQPATQVHS